MEIKTISTNLTIKKMLGNMVPRLLIWVCHRWPTHFFLLNGSPAKARLSVRLNDAEGEEPRADPAKCRGEIIGMPKMITVPRSFPDK